MWYLWAVKGSWIAVHKTERCEHQVQSTHSGRSEWGESTSPEERWWRAVVRADPVWSEADWWQETRVYGEETTAITNIHECLFCQEAYITVSFCPDNKPVCRERNKYKRMKQYIHRHEVTEPVPFMHLLLIQWLQSARRCARCWAYRALPNWYCCCPPSGLEFWRKCIQHSPH